MAVNANGNYQNGDSTKKGPKDSHEVHIWVAEPRIERHGVLTQDGMVQIAEHKYKAGDYTYLDTHMSPLLWQPLTDLLPMWVAPNVVTTIGGCFCFVAFCLSSYFLAFTEGPPQWLFLSNGFCLFCYYTFDCMDGKQARRTGSSSPLGQLFDHGMDCICNLCHLQTVQCIVMVHPLLFALVQCSLQFTFWQAQWEEYYTGILPHSAGQIGVTEVNYGLCLWNVLTGVFGRGMYDTPVFPETLSKWSIPAWLSGGEDATLQIRHLVAIAWFSFILCEIFPSWVRVYRHVQDTKLFLSAWSKVLSPLVLCIVTVLCIDVNPTTGNSALWRSLGLCFCLLTIKTIIFSMARMAYATFQVDIVPFVAVVTWVHFTGDQYFDASWLVPLLDFWYLARIMYWANQAMTQLCKHLNIHLFRIPVKAHQKST